MDPLALLHRFKADVRLRTLILLVNVVGILYGFYYYLPQFAVTPWYLWPLVADSPLAVLLITVPLVLYHRGWRHDVLDAVAVVANVKVGLWTVYVLVAYESFFGTWDPAGLNFWLLWGHLGMALEAGVLLHELQGFTARAWTGLLAAFLVSDWYDYVYEGFVPPYLEGTACRGLRPYTVPCVPEMEVLLRGVTVGLTFLGVAVAWWGARSGGLSSPSEGPASAR